MAKKKSDKTAWYSNMYTYGHKCKDGTEVDISIFLDYGPRIKVYINMPTKQKVGNFRSCFSAKKAYAKNVATKEEAFEEGEKLIEELKKDDFLDLLKKEGWKEEK